MAQLKRQASACAAPGGERPRRVALVGRTSLLAIALAVGATALGSAGVAEAKCAFTQPCHSGVLDSDCHAVPYDGEPTPMNWTGIPIQCPQYKESACCNHFQNQYLFTNFILINAAFGLASGGGCPACAANLKQLWCQYTCSPNQADFVDVLGLRNMTDPAAPDPQPITTVLDVLVRMDKKTACAIYASCRDCSRARQVQTLHTCDGFLDYQGKYEAVGRGNYMNFDYTPPAQAKEALAYDAYKCENYTLPGTDTSASCPCGSCRAACSAPSGETVDLAEITKLAQIDPINGAHWSMIGIAYAVISIASIGILFYRSRYH